MMSSLAAVTTSPSLVRLASAGACLAVGQGIWFAYLITFAVSVLDYDLKAAGIAFAIMQATSVGGRILLGWLADRYGSPRRLLGLLGLASGLSSLAMAIVGPAGASRQLAPCCGRWRLCVQLERRPTL